MAILFFILLFVFAIGYEVMTIDKERDSWRDIYFVLKEKWYGGGWRRFITCGGRGSKRESALERNNPTYTVKAGVYNVEWPLISFLPWSSISFNLVHA